MQRRKHNYINNFYFIILIYLFESICLFLISCKTPSIIVTQEQQQGDLSYNNRQYETAIVHYQNYLEKSAKLGTFRNLDMEAGICRKMAHGYSALGQYGNALEYANKALITDSLRNNSLEFIEDYRLTGNLCLYKGDFFKGISLLEYALELNKPMENSLKGLNQRSVAEAYLSLARVNSVLGRFYDALEYIEKALSLFSKNNDKLGLMEVWLIKGKIYTNQGQIREAISNLETSLELAKELDINSSRQHQALGEAYSITADFEKALRYKFNALDEAYNSRIIPQMIWSNIGVGDAYADLGDHQEADTYYKRAVQLQDSSKINALALQASAGMRLGDLYEAQEYYSTVRSDVVSGLLSLRQGDVNYEAGNIDEALDNYQNAVIRFQGANVPEGMSKAYLRMGEIYIELNNIIAAEGYLREAAKLTISDESQWKASYQRGRLFETAGQPDSAVTYYKNAIQVIEDIRGRFTNEEYKAKYIDNKVKVYDQLIKLLIELGQAEDAFMYSERARARAFLDMIANQKIEIKKGTDQGLIQKEQELRLKMNVLSKTINTGGIGSYRGMPGSAVEKELLDAREEYSQILERIKLVNSEYASMVSIDPAGIQEIQKSIDKETALLAYWIGEDYMAIWVITNNSIIPYFSLVGSSAMTQFVTESYKAVQHYSELRNDDNVIATNRPFIQESGLSPADQLNHMYKVLIWPVYENIKEYPKIGIVPHSSLHFLPFQALLSNDGKFLIENHSLFYIPSASVFVYCNQKKSVADKEILAMALGDLNIGNFSGLPGTTCEVQGIGELFENKIIKFEKESSESFFKKNASDFKFIHLATHGMMNEKQPLYSYLLFCPTEEDDGLLTVNEVFGLNLNSRLVTLSACQTGLGDLSKGDEMVGLSRAFIYAGSPAVIVSLWSIADRPTAMLMTEFYKQLNAFSPQEALRIAQLKLMNDYPSPFYWAPFQLIGKGN